MAYTTNPKLLLVRMEARKAIKISRLVDETSGYAYRLQSKRDCPMTDSYRQDHDRLLQARPVNRSCLFNLAVYSPTNQIFLRQTLSLLKNNLEILLNL